MPTSPLVGRCSWRRGSDGRLRATPAVVAPPNVRQSRTPPPSSAHGPTRRRPPDTPKYPECPVHDRARSAAERRRAIASMRVQS
jgi:hypothetical protein